MKKRRTVLVTGGCGFIGANFVRLLHQDWRMYRVINLDKLTYAGNLSNLSGVVEGEFYKFVKGDICDSQLLDKVFKEEKIDTVVHFAAESHVDRSIFGPQEFIQTNIVGTFSLLEVAKKHWLDQEEVVDEPCFIHVSTDEVYGSLGKRGYFTEKTSYDPRSPYSASKASSDHIVNAYYHTYGLPVRITNCSNNYGPYQFPEKLIPLVIFNSMNNKTLPVYGDGKNVRDWLYVKDHCEAIVEVLHKGKNGECYNIGGNNEKKNIEIVTTICDLIDKKIGLLETSQPRTSLITYVKDRLGHDKRYAIDATKIKDQIGWEPKVTFEKGIGITLNWYLENQDWVTEIVSGDYLDYYEKMYNKQ